MKEFLLKKREVSILHGFIGVVIGVAISDILFRDLIARFVFIVLG